MDEKTRKFLNGVYPYLCILDDANKKMLALKNTNYESTLHETEELFYQISSDLIRLFPIKIPPQKKRVLFWKINNGRLDYKKAKVDERCGIFLLKSHIPFLLKEYRVMLEDFHLVRVMDVVKTVRNKYEHEPHNISLTSMVGNNTFCSMCVRYKNKLLPMKTQCLENILYDLNRIFTKIKELYMHKLEECDDAYKGYPCYKTICDVDFLKYNQIITHRPWELIICDEEE